jgi:hypothetical protein
LTGRYRVGAHWGVTIVELGDGPMTGEGRREGDRRIAVAQTPEDARRIVDALNAQEVTVVP